MKTLEELKVTYLEHVESNKAGHDVAVVMGALGVSSRYMTMYTESIRLIKEYEDRKKERFQ